MRTPSKKEMQKYYESLEQTKKQKANQVFPTRNMGFVIFDIIPIGQRKALLEGIPRLFVHLDLNEAFKKENGLGYPWSEVLGNIVPLDSTIPEMEHVAKVDLPEPFESLDMEVGQSLPFCYYLAFACRLRPEFQEGVDTAFLDAIASAKTFRELWFRDVYEPRIRKYQIQIETFLAKFFHGIFLSDRAEGKLSCPSIRVMTSNEIDFENFPAWRNSHESYSDYLGLTFPYSRQERFLVCWQRDRLPQISFPAGLYFVASSRHMLARGDRSPAADPTHFNVLSAGISVTRSTLLPIFTALYWTASRLERTLPGWETNVTATEGELAKTISNARGLGKIRHIYADLTHLLSRFETFAVEEQRNVSMMKRSLSNVKPPELTPLPIIREEPELDAFTGLADNVTRLVEQEGEMLEFVRRKIFSNFEQCKQQTDFALQSSMRTLTIAAVIPGFLAITAPYVREIWAAITSFLIWLTSQ